MKTVVILISLVLLAGCKGTPTRGEKEARRQLQAVAGHYRPEGRKPELPALTSQSGLSNYLAYALLNQPRVEAAYYDYSAAVERITVERSLPDPRLTLELDIQDVVTTVMPGLMTDLPWLQKLRLRADVATAESQARYFGFETAVLQTAFEVKRPYYQLYFLNERLRVSREMLALREQLDHLARARIEAAQGTVQEALEAQIERDRLKTDIANLADSRHPMLAQLKAALGLTTDQPDPPMPAGFESTPLDLTSERLFADALARNPRLRAMEAEVRMAETGIRLARTSRLPDFNAGLEVDTKASPVMWRPTLGATLPIWRDKIAAEIASAQALKRAAEARLSAERIQLAVEFADQSFTFREATRNLRLLTESLLPTARQALEVARAGYTSGRVDFINLLEAERSLLEFQLAEVEARTRRELVLAEVSLLILGVPPPGAPVLTAASASPPATGPTAARK